MDNEISLAFSIFSIPISRLKYAVDFALKNERNIQRLLECFDRLKMIG